MNCVSNCVRWGPGPPGKGSLGSNPSQNMQLQIAAATWQIETRSDSAILPNYFGARSGVQIVPAVCIPRAVVDYSSVTTI